MSFSITPSAAVRNHPTNNSTSKEIHMFSKSKRFPMPNPECPNAFYSYDSQLSTRKASIGYGDKADWTKDLTASPPVTKYEISSFIQDNASHSKGKTFGTCRDKLPDNSYLVPQIQKIPGPGAYDNEKHKKKDFKYTMRPKPLDFIQENLTSKKTPGPAAHQEVDLFPKKGRLSVGKYADIRYSIIHPHTERFATIKQSPGPSSYREGDSLNGDSNFVLSHRKSNGRRVFSKTAKYEDGFWKNSTNPGPGSYMETTQFGRYGNSNYYRTLGK